MMDAVDLSNRNLFVVGIDSISHVTSNYSDRDRSFSDSQKVINVFYSKPKNRPAMSFPFSLFPSFLLEFFRALDINSPKNRWQDGEDISLMNVTFI